MDIFAFMQSFSLLKKYLEPLPSVKTQASQWLPTSCFAAAAVGKLIQASVSSDTLTRPHFILHPGELVISLRHTAVNRNC